MNRGSQGKIMKFELFFRYLSLFKINFSFVVLGAILKTGLRRGRNKVPVFSVAPQNEKFELTQLI